MGAEDFVAELDALARAAGEAEAAFRRGVAKRAAELERARAFAFRRYNVIKDVAAAMRPHAEETADSQGMERDRNGSIRRKWAAQGAPKPGRGSYCRRPRP